MDLRPSQPEDGPAVAALLDGLGYRTRASCATRRLRELPPHHHVLVAEEDGVLLGFVHVHVDHGLIDGTWAQLEGIAVADAARGRGVARALLNAAEAWAGERGVDRLLVRSSTARTGAHRFYRSRGYTPRQTQLVFDKRLDVDAGR